MQACTGSGHTSQLAIRQVLSSPYTQLTANPSVPEAPRPELASRGVTEGQTTPPQDPGVANRKGSQGAVYQRTDNQNGSTFLKLHHPKLRRVAHLPVTPTDAKLRQPKLR